MYQNIEPYLEHVKGNTYCIVTGYARIPLYQLDRANCILIDSGLHEDGKGIISCLERENLSVKAVLTSHSHIDHVGNHLALRRHFGARLYMSMFAAAANAEPVNLACCLPDFTTYRRLQPFMEGHFKPDVLMDWSADSIEVEGAIFQILHLPGHDAEHLGNCQLGIKIWLYTGGVGGSQCPDDGLAQYGVGQICHIVRGDQPHMFGVVPRQV